ncbi:LOW QUALITY PROTEIN: putative small intestine urate exporter [Lycaon pictus]
MGDYQVKQSREGMSDRKLSALPDKALELATGFTRMGVIDGFAKGLLVSSFCLVRHGLALIVHLCNFLILSQQMNLSIAMPATVNNTTLLGPLNASMERPSTDSQDSWNEMRFSVIQAPTCDWSPEVQGIILSSINYVSILAPIPTGYIAGIFEAKYLVGVGLLFSSILTFFIPLAADAGVALLMVLQIVQGIAQVMVLTSQYIWVKWAPPLEKNQLIRIAVSDASLYNPLSHFGPQNQGIRSRIFMQEMQIGCMNSDSSHCDPQLIGEDWCGSSEVCTLLISGPQSRILSALLISIAFISTILGGLLADFLLSRKILRLMTIRKFSTAIGVVVPSVVLVSLHWVRSNLSTSMVSLALSSATTTFCYAGALINFLDIAPQ